MSLLNYLVGGQANNGMNGLFSKFKNRNNDSSFSDADYPHIPSRDQFPTSQYRTAQYPPSQQPRQLQSIGQPYGQDPRASRRDGRRDRNGRRDRRQGRYEDRGYASDQLVYSAHDGREIPTDEYGPRGLQVWDDGYGRRRSPDDGDGQYGFDGYSQHSSSPVRRQVAGFRPFALPQVAYGEGKPFLRGYSDELQQYGILEQEFLKIVDTLNEAIIPNPEGQLLQKAASIAGWFVPGVDGIAIAAGQIAVGVAAGIGHGTALSKRLAKANLTLFVPAGLELCIGKGRNVDEETGISPDSQAFQGDVDPEAKIRQYGDYLMPMSVMYPEQKQYGRQDPVAQISRGMSARDAQRNMRGAMKEQQRGRRTKKADSLEGHLQWLIVRKASADSTKQWLQTLHTNEEAIAQKQTQS